MDLMYFTPSFWTHKCLGSFISINSFPRPLPSHNTSTFHITNTILPITHGGGGDLWRRGWWRVAFVSYSFHGQAILYQTRVTYTPMCGFIFFPFLRTLESNKQQSKEGNKQWVVVRFVGCILLQSKKNNQNQTKFVNKVVKFLSTKCEEIVDFACCVVYAPFGNTPLELLILFPRFKRKLVFGDAILKRHNFQDIIRVWGCKFGKAHCSRHN